ncbi:MAG: hypothetical protein GC159_14535 [Phycisphaera sp.]|nr:hypothetical protein [Phycisphaera sp.]
MTDVNAMDEGTARAVVRRLVKVRPRDRRQLRGWVKAVLGIDVPDEARCDGHACPMDYLERVFFERGGDTIVWANRGGGKTFYGAVATLLDLVFKPGVEVCILGGSLDQSSRMYRYLRRLLDRPGLREMVDGAVTARGVRLRNGSRVELLCASQTSVRGRRVQKLRCDEVDLFDAELWTAAQFVTRSAKCGGVDVRGSIECLSTMHRPFGMMHTLVEGAAAAGATVMRWCTLDVMATCEPERDCDACALREPCGGRAKAWRGFLPVDDVLAQRSRSSAVAFESEMLCRRPSRSDAVYPAFDYATHVRTVEADAAATWIGGMDFGMRSPLVMLWAQVREATGDGAGDGACDGAGDGEEASGAGGAMRSRARECKEASGAGGAPRSPRVEVIDEYICSDATVERHLAAIDARGWPGVAWLGVDPAGHQRSSHTGCSTIELLRRAGHRVRARRVGLRDGIERVRRMIDPADGPPRLIVHPRCRRLIEALSTYHFDTQRPYDEQPVKDGPDHAADALRYMIINLGAADTRVTVRHY